MKSTTAPLLLATTNKGKITEFRDLLGGLASIAAPSDSSYASLPCPDVEENGATYFENALKKATAFQKVYGTPVLADDSGLEVEALGGGPGIFSARFGGTAISWPERWSALHRALVDKPAPWAARFRCVLCYYDGVKVPQFFEGVCEGDVLAAPRGNGGFGYDPIVRIASLGKTFGEATSTEKQAVSHRAVAVRAFANWWKPSLHA